MAVFDDLAAFAAVVRAKSFTRAAAQIGVTQSALSQTVRSLERRLDLKLLNRTTRSVAPTEAGEQLFRTVEPRLAEIEAELAVLGNMRGRPVGTVRITATEHAVRSIVWPRLLPWLPNYPEIKVEISSDNRFVDIVAERFDIGIRLGGDVAKNMIALRIAPDMRMVVVGSPAYFERNQPPKTPSDLSEHDCIGLRLPTYGGMLAWEFKHGERITSTHVEGRLVFNRSDLMADAAVAGNGLAWLPDDMARDHLAAGRLVTTLDDWAITFPGYHLYYASRRSSSALSLVVDALRLPKSC
ncbi:LysR family transcriptional regulator [Undibacterium sp. Tian12W]|uniref:LysR family transcriptional regulator n=1 Tax=Undibacterium sp. Tian12W TaxID=3413054 RepID=UPI003BF093C6